MAQQCRAFFEVGRADDAAQLVDRWEEDFLAVEHLAWSTASDVLKEQVGLPANQRLTVSALLSNVGLAALDLAGCLCAPTPHPFSFGNVVARRLAEVVRDKHCGVEWLTAVREAADAIAAEAPEGEEGDAGNRDETSRFVRRALLKLTRLLRIRPYVHDPQQPSPPCDYGSRDGLLSHVLLESHVAGPLADLCEKMIEMGLTGRTGLPVSFSLGLHLSLLQHLGVLLPRRLLESSEVLGRSVSATGPHYRISAADVQSVISPVRDEVTRLNLGQFVQDTVTCRMSSAETRDSSTTLRCVGGAVPHKKGEEA